MQAYVNDRLIVVGAMVSGLKVMLDHISRSELNTDHARYVITKEIGILTEEFTGLKRLHNELAGIKEAAEGNHRQA